MARKSAHTQVAVLVKVVKINPDLYGNITLAVHTNGKILVKRSGGRGWKVWALLGARYTAFVPNVIDYFKANGYEEQV